MTIVKSISKVLVGIITSISTTLSAVSLQMKPTISQPLRSTYYCRYHKHIMYSRESDVWLQLDFFAPKALFTPHS
ncbi:hypothetical protein AOQ84DRAFT_96550 [Glonium stellatum]|uniref:Uncharacterized protein n=1 Tax=Glonium stellatum TaxID=574774 RepID=A0A8E2FAW8_9PEZI|nr:hypothetical protein AOQ84DRAFT_96550 [Glonium stellatum]